MVDSGQECPLSFKVDGWGGYMCKILTSNSLILAASLTTTEVIASVERREVDVEGAHEFIRANCGVLRRPVRLRRIHFPSKWMVGAVTCVKF